MNTLISISDLMAQSWNFLSDHWKPLLKRTLWFVLILIAYLVVAIPATMNQIWSIYIIDVILCAIAGIAAVNHIYLYILKEIRPNGSPLLSRRAIDLVPPALWIGVLVGLAAVAGSILLILPGIWIGTALGFAHLFLLEDDARGTKAWSASYALVRGRWWPTFWRIFVPSFLMGIVVWFLSMITWFIVSLVAGGAILTLGASFSEGTSNVGMSGGAIGIVGLIVGVLIGFAIQCALFFVSIVFSMITRVKLFHSLKDTKGSVATPAQHS